MTANTMTIEEFATYLSKVVSHYTREGDAFTVRHDLYLSSLTTLPEGVTLSAGGYLYLSSLTTLPEGVTLSAGGSLYLSSLTTLPEGVTLSAGGYLDLSSLTTLPEGVTLSAGGYLDLSSLTTEEQTYQGKAIRLRTIDGYTMRLISKRKIGPVTLWSAQHFKGDPKTDKRSFVAQDGETYAHGDTAESALRDLRFKIASRDFDVDDLVAKIKARGTVEFNDYRLLTGACESGTRQHLIERGQDPDAESIPLAEALALSKGGYGGDTFARLLAA
jgi:hypothetical protein